MTKSNSNVLIKISFDTWNAVSYQEYEGAMETGSFLCEW